MNAQLNVTGPDLTAAARERLEALVHDRVASRLFAGDSTLWGEAAEAEARVRLGWVRAHEDADELIAEITALRDEFRSRQVNRFILCGMGGSSLAPEVIAQSQSLDLMLLDSTHPDTVRRMVEQDLSRVGVIVSSKSGSTVETRSHLEAFTRQFQRLGIDPAERIVIVTDPGSALESEARAAGMHVFLAQPDVGGRFSALTAFGLVPTGLAGADIDQLVRDAENATQLLNRDSVHNPALQLAAALLPEESAQEATRIEFFVGEHAAASQVSGIGDWIEQLVAESSGKNGRGVLPVVMGALTDDAHAHALTLSNRIIEVDLAASDGNDAVGEDSPSAIRVCGPLGTQFLLWEAATAVLCRLLGVNPFDQPDVESAKVAAREALARAQADDQPHVDVEAAEEAAQNLAASLAELRGQIPDHGYLAIQAYLDRIPQNMGALEQLRAELSRAWELPVTVGWGPRYLHSSGQLHKGGPRIGGYLQLTDTPEPDSGLLSGDATFAALIASQASGDLSVLRAHGRPVLALDVSRLPEILETLGS